MGVFNLKLRDTLPTLDVVLRDPVPAGAPPGTVGAVHNLTGSTAWKLRIRLSSGVILVRDMVKVGADSAGTLRYAWVATDWDAASAANGQGEFTVGGLVAGPTLPLQPTDVEHKMEYEVVGPGGARQTFPNDAADPYDILRITADLGQG